MHIVPSNCPAFFITQQEADPLQTGLMNFYCSTKSHNSDFLLYQRVTAKYSQENSNIYLHEELKELGWMVKNDGSDKPETPSFSPKSKCNMI